MISDKANHEELPEIRAKEMKQKLNDSISKKEKSLSKSPVRQPDRPEEKELNDLEVSNILTPLPVVIKKRKRFAKPGMNINMDGTVTPETKLNDANKIKEILSRMPDFDDRLIRNKCKIHLHIIYCSARVPYKRKK